MSAAMPKLTTLILYVCNNISDSFGVSVLKICLFLNMCVCVCIYEHEFRGACVAMNRCNSPCRHEDLNPGHVEEQLELLTMAPSL